MRFKYVLKNKINSLPKTAGVYAFKNNKEGLLYIGKAGNIKQRAKTHFNQPNYRDELFINKTEKIGYIKTDSEIEALILESELIKKYRPSYNVLWKDDKNYFYVAITKERLPRVFITHQPRKKLRIKNQELRIKENKTHNSLFLIHNSDMIGPFVDGNSLKKTLRILRKTFPYYSQKKHSKNLCPWCHLNLCPGPNPNVKKYKKDINNLKNILKGKNQTVLKNLKKEMAQASRNQEFERAGELRDKINFLEQTLTNAKILTFSEKYQNWERTENDLKKIINTSSPISRIEGYDISNIQGKMATGSMVVFINGKPAKNLYRKFKIKYENSPAGEPNDTAMLKEVLKRRITHKEWPLPDLFLIDGGKGQLNAAKNTLGASRQVPSNIMALAKKHNELFLENKKDPLLLKNLPREVSDLILQIRDEAHRFAIAYHKKLREIDLGLRK